MQPRASDPAVIGDTVSGAPAAVDADVSIGPLVRLGDLEDVEITDREDVPVKAPPTSFRPPPTARTHRDAIGRGALPT